MRFAEDVAALAQAEESATSLEFADIDVAELIAKTAAALSGRYRAKAVSLSTHLPTTELPPLWADEQRLSQVLANLLDNALRHTPPHGRVDVHADADGSRLLLRVSDTGEGIAPEHLPHVFERLYRADAARTRDHGGSGLGLAIAKALVEANGGDISASSQGVGTGTTFTIALPLPRRCGRTACRHVRSVTVNVDASDDVGPVAGSHNCSSASTVPCGKLLAVCGTDRRRVKQRPR